MKRAISISLLIFLLVAGFWWFTQRPQPVAVLTPPASPLTNFAGFTSSANSNSVGKSMSGVTPPLLGEVILRDYASPSTSPENDLTSLAHLMDNYTLLVKSAFDRPLSANEDWAAALRGLNPAHERFLPDKSIALDDQGRLVDRWGTPLFFHAIGNRQFELRSAGPDKKLWTDDDVHRNANGSFRHGAALNPASLLEPAKQ
ncbi:MAG: hypothetical protein WDN00_11865 [Limisphaerales bacterium]